MLVFFFEICGVKREREKRKHPLLTATELAGTVLTAAEAVRP